MATLLLRLAAPIQAWGDESKYDIRQTWKEPSKSGVIGLLASALGLSRDSGEIANLGKALRMGVRVEMPGQIVKDFHTALPPKYTAKGEVRHEADGSVMEENAPYVTTRYYLCDACFLVGLESDDEELLQRLEEAMQAPCFAPYLGRRACPPTLPLLLGIRKFQLEDTLRKEEWQAPEWYRRKHPGSKLRVILETAAGEEAWHSMMDTPVSFSPTYRQYSPRGLKKEQYVMVGDGGHDPMTEL